MKIKFIQAKEEKLVENFYTINDTTELKDLPDYDWIEINTNDRSELLKHQLGLIVIGPELKNYILNPGSIRRAKHIDGIEILDLNIGHSNDSQELDYITFLFHSDKMISIAAEGNEFFKKVQKELAEIISKDNLKIEQILLCLLDLVLDENELKTINLKKKIDLHSRNTIQRNEIIDIGEIEKIKDDLIKLDEVLENQYVAIGILPVFNLNNSGIDLEINIKNMVAGIEHLQRLVEKLDRKIEFIYKMYLNDLQEIGNKKLNTLTIVQAIFVPLTFIAGIYGMNFVLMPELNWHFGYLYAIVLMIIIVLIELYIFYRNGWFK